MCVCQPFMIVPVDPQVAVFWWGYKHSSDGKWHIKRWFPYNDRPGVDCDLCYARREKFEEGNDFIDKITPYPIYALDDWHAKGILENIEKNLLGPDTWQNKYPDKRFVDLLDE